MSTVTNCPECHAENALETSLKIDLDNVLLTRNADGELHVAAFDPAGSANDPSSGLVIEEARVTCRECGHEVDAIIPTAIMRHWRYFEHPYMG